MDIDDFFKKIIDGYLLHDLKNMNEVRQKSGEPAGALGYPMLATTVSAMELLGGILQTNELYNDTPHSSKGYFQHYWNTYLTTVDNRYSDKSDIFWILIRHGVAHTYFTKLGITVTKRKPSKHLLSTRSGLNVDCSVFYMDFLKAYEQVKRNLKDTVYRNKVQDNIKELFRLSNKKSSDYINALYGDGYILSTTMSGDIFEPAMQTQKSISYPLDKLLSSTNRASGASFIAGPVDNIEELSK